MHNRQLAKIRMYDRCLGFYQENNTVFSAFKPLNTEAEEAKADLKKLHDTNDHAGAVTAGITAGTAALRTAMIDALLPLTRTALGWAMKERQAAAIPLFNIHESDFVKISLDRGAVLAQKTIAALTDNSPALQAAVGIDIKEIAVAQAAKDAFAEAIKNTAIAQSANETATGDVTALFPVMDAHFAIMDTYIDGQFGKSQPTLVTQWHILREIGKTTRSHTGIRALVRDSDGSPLEGTLMTITESGRTALSGVDGIAELSKMKAGTYHIAFKKEGVEKTLAVHVGLGAMEDVAVVM